MGGRNRDVLNAFAAQAVEASDKTARDEFMVLSVLVKSGAPR
jgi:hypothetical protein